MTHQELVVQTRQDSEFASWVDEVSPRVRGVQPVFFAELFLILQILWEIYSWMKKLGWFDRWLKTLAVKRAMRKATRVEQERALQTIRTNLSKIVPV